MGRIACGADDETNVAGAPRPLWRDLFFRQRASGGAKISTKMGLNIERICQRSRVARRLQR